MICARRLLPSSERTGPVLRSGQIREFGEIGRVDLVVDGWLVVECDSKAFHSSWDQQREDRRRDQALAALGYVVYRPIAEDILYHPDLVIAALKGLLALPMRRSAQRAQEELAPGTGKRPRSDRSS